MGMLDGRVALVTGAGSGIGREHALCLAAEGAAVLATDLAGADDTAAAIADAGGRAIAMTADCSDWPQSQALVAKAVEAFGGLHVLVNNAGVNRKVLFEVSDETDWEVALTGNLKTAVAPTRAAVGHWRAEADADRPVRASVINTSSGAGLIGNPGQSTYGAAKAAVAAMTVIAAQELAGLGVRLNAIAPAARTPMSSVTPVVAEMMKPPEDPVAFDAWHPAEVSPLVAYLASNDCTITGQVFHVRGGMVACFEGWTLGPAMRSEAPWTVAEIAAHLPGVMAQVAERSASRAAPNADLRRRLAQSLMAGAPRIGAVEDE